MAKRETVIVDVARCSCGGRIAIDGDQPTAWTQCGEDRARMTAATECRVDHDVVLRYRQCGHGFVEQDRDVLAIGHQSEKPSSSAGSAPASNAMAWAVCACHCA